MGDNKEKPLHIAMYPWFALGNMTSFLDLANKLAKRGHNVSFFLPTKTQPKLTSHNHHPHLITFIPVVVPAIEGLPTGAETTADVPYASWSDIMSAMDLTRPTIETLLSQLKPNLVFFDLADWVPKVAHENGAWAVYYDTRLPVSAAYYLPHGRIREPVGQWNMALPPPGFPTSKSMIRLQRDEAITVLFIISETDTGGKAGKPMLARRAIAAEECDALAIKACKEIDGEYCDYIGDVHNGKPLLLAGPVVPEPPAGKLDEQLDGWLNGFGKGSVVYFGLGSEISAPDNFIQEILLGLEISGLPFVAVLKPPMNDETIESALPKGFTERTKGRGVVRAWDSVQQQLILQHPAVGCFVNPCDARSLSEAIMSDCQLVFLPLLSDQFINSRMMSSDLKIGVEVERDAGRFAKENVCNAIKKVMDMESEVRANHAKWRELLLSEGLEESYIHGFIENLRALLE